MHRVPFALHAHSPNETFINLRHNERSFSFSPHKVKFQHIEKTNYHNPLPHPRSSSTRSQIVSRSVSASQHALSRSRRETTSTGHLWSRLGGAGVGGRTPRAPEADDGKREKVHSVVLAMEPLVLGRPSQPLRHRGPEKELILIADVSFFSFCYGRGGCRSECCNYAVAVGRLYFDDWVRSSMNEC